jgi:hypothetical protein
MSTGTNRAKQKTQRIAARGILLVSIRSDRLVAFCIVRGLSSRLFGLGVVFYHFLALCRGPRMLDGWWNTLAAHTFTMLRHHSPVLVGGMLPEFLGTEYVRSWG